MTDKLKECPVSWCKRDDPPHTWQDCRDEWLIICPACGVNGPIAATEEDAADLWNALTRHPPAPLSEETVAKSHVERLSEWLSSNAHPLHHASPGTLASGLIACQLTLVTAEASSGCCACGREYGESHREDCPAIEIDGEFVV